MQEASIINIHTFLNWTRRLATLHPETFYTTPIWPISLLPQCSSVGRTPSGCAGREDRSRGSAASPQHRQPEIQNKLLVGHQKTNAPLHLADDLVDIWDARNCLVVRGILLVQAFPAQDCRRRKISEDSLLHLCPGSGWAQMLVAKSNNLLACSDLMIVGGRTIWSQKLRVESSLHDWEFSISRVLDGWWRSNHYLIFLHQPCYALTAL